ncbi:hypothetical protein [Halomicrococcus sp. NG-SE-24]|uniref:hypothetical protein n=1 Tax=Halomicrococcus sp. NG-SE-24 TaxID=3436928 RepID=UPI003D990308
MGDVEPRVVEEPQRERAALAQQRRHAVGGTRGAVRSRICGSFSSGGKRSPTGSVAVGV